MADCNYQADRDGPSVLYLSFDGMCDQIGQSQVLPYLIGCARAGHKITVISLEKPARLKALGTSVEALFAAEGVRWLPRTFHSRPPYLAKLIDLLSLVRAAVAEARLGYDLIHARSYVAGLAALKVTRRSGTPLLFDMRGFWADQRREGRRWRARHLIGELLYRRWKRHERALVENSDHIVVLTETARNEVRAWPCYKGAPISVIPCCADFKLFTPADTQARVKPRERLGIPSDAPVLGYLGSIGTVYMLDQVLRLFEAFRRLRPEARLLFVGQENLQPIRDEARQLGISIRPGELCGVHAERADVPYWLGAIDIGTCFITPSYSSKGVSATKLAEYLACGIPVVANRGIGDTDAILREVDGGHIMPDFSDESVADAADAAVALLNAERKKIRERAKPLLDLPVAVSAYRAIYDRLPAAAATEPR